jgi:uncharacterized Fe-S cluster-containing protein
MHSRYGAFAPWLSEELIAENRDGIFSIRDGIHRLGALQKLQKEKFFVIIWDDYSVDNILKELRKGKDK